MDNGSSTGYSWRCQSRECWSGAVADEITSGASGRRIRSRIRDGNGRRGAGRDVLLLTSVSEIRWINWLLFYAWNTRWGSWGVLWRTGGVWVVIGCVGCVVTCCTWMNGLGHVRKGSSWVSALDQVVMTSHRLMMA